MNKDEELINHLAEKLKSHELPYKEGAWEKFAQSQKIPVVKSAKLVRSLSVWTAVAAAVLLMATASIYLYHQDANQNSVTQTVTQTALNQPVAPATIVQSPSLQTAPAPQHPAVSNGNSAAVSTGTGTAGIPTIGPATFPNATHHASANNQSTTPNPSSDPANINFQKYTIQDLNILSKSPMASNTNRAIINPLSAVERLHPGIKTIPATNPVAAANSSSRTNSTTLKKQASSNANQPPGTAAPASQDSYAATKTFDDQGYIDPDAPKNRQNKWDMGVMVVPGMGNDSKLNLGYGVNVGYKLNNKLSLNSGLAYSQMSGTKDVSQGADGITSGVRSLSSIDANVTGVTLPLELRYSVSQKIYVGAGVSALAVISNKMDRNYSINQLQSTAFVSKNGNLLKPQQIEALTSDIKSKESIPQQQIDSKNFAGFLNFSFGFKQKLNKSKALSIEPFISLPMSNNLSSQNIRLTDGGIRVKIGL